MAVVITSLVKRVINPAQDIRKYQEGMQSGYFGRGPDTSNEQQSRRPRRLPKLTIHSLRHYTIIRFAKQANGNLILTSRFARHRNPSILQGQV